MDSDCPRSQQYVYTLHSLYDTYMYLLYYILNSETTKIKYIISVHIIHYRRLHGSNSENNNKHLSAVVWPETNRSAVAAVFRQRYSLSLSPFLSINTHNIAHIFNRYAHKKKTTNECLTSSSHHHDYARAVRRLTIQ